jgi:osmotically-inducible protein OsmY
MTNKTSPLRLGALCAALALTQGLSGCAPLVVGGAMAATTLMATDRRSAGTQVDDQSNELKALSAIQGAIGERGHVNATSFNRVLLLSGEVPTEADKQAVANAVTQIPTVRYLVNELAVMPNSSMGTRTNDTITTGKVKAAFVDSSSAFNSIKVVTERGVVYLMGLVTEPEANRAVEIARGIGGVVKVVRVFQIIAGRADAIEFKAARGRRGKRTGRTSAGRRAPSAAPSAAPPGGATTTPVKP